MINEKPEMGFTEYLNAHYLKRHSSFELKEFYIKQASALEKALGIEDNRLAQSFIASFHKTYTIMLDNYICGGLIEWEGCETHQDSGFINYILSQRMLILEYLRTYNRMRGPSGLKLPVDNVEEEKVHEFLEYVGRSGKALLKEMEWYDQYIWGRLTEGKPWIKIPLTELKEKYGYPDRPEVDVLAEEELEWLKVLGVEKLGVEKIQK